MRSPVCVHGRFTCRYACIWCVQYPRRTKEGAVSPGIGIGVRTSWQLPHGCWCFRSKFEKQRKRPPFQMKCLGKTNLTLDQAGVLRRVNTQETGSVFGVYSNFGGGGVSSVLPGVQSHRLIQLDSLKRIGNGGRGRGSLCQVIQVLE